MRSGKKGDNPDAGILKIFDRFGMGNVAHKVDIHWNFLKGHYLADHREFNVRGNPGGFHHNVQAANKRVASDMDDIGLHAVTPHGFPEEIGPGQVSYSGNLKPVYQKSGNLTVVGCHDPIKAFCKKKFCYVRHHRERTADDCRNVWLYLNGFREKFMGVIDTSARSAKQDGKG